jgi:hypothetical protein
VCVLCVFHRLVILFGATISPTAGDLDPLVVHNWPNWNDGVRLNIHCGGENNAKMNDFPGTLFNWACSYTDGPVDLKKSKQILVDLFLCGIAFHDYDWVFL